MKAIGNLILMTLICVFVFIVFMAIRPARAQHWQFTPWGLQFSIAAYGPARIPLGFQARPLPDPYAYARGGKLALYGEEDVRCRAATVGNSVNAIIPIKRPSDDVVQTAPVKCRYTESGI